MLQKDKYLLNKKKEIALDQLSKVLESSFLLALTEPSRIQVLIQVIRKDRSTIKELKVGMKLDRSVISRHLRLLSEAGILIREKEGRQVFYQLNPFVAVKTIRVIMETIEETIKVCCPP